MYAGMPSENRSKPSGGFPLTVPMMLCGAMVPAVLTGTATAWSDRCRRELPALLAEWEVFAAQRVKEDLGLVQRIATARSPLDIWAAYADFWQRAYRDYSQEMMAMLSHARAAEGDVTAPARANDGPKASGERKAA
jgi:hypothetical protein